MELHGKNLIAGQLSAEGDRSVIARDPSTGTELSPAFFEATTSEIDRAVSLASSAALPFSRCTPDRSPADTVIPERDTPGRSARA